MGKPSSSTLELQSNAIATLVLKMTGYALLASDSWNCKSATCCSLHMSFEVSRMQLYVHRLTYKQRSLTFGTYEFIINSSIQLYINYVNNYKLYIVGVWLIISKLALAIHIATPVYCSYIRPTFINILRNCFLSINPSVSAIVSKVNNL